MSKKALIIEDEADIRELIAMSLDRIGLDTHTAANLGEARNLLDSYQFDVCLTDMKLPDGNGVEFVRYATTVQPGLPVAVITAHGNMDAAVDAMKSGAFDFVSKPVDMHLLRKLVSQALKLSQANPHTENTSHQSPSRSEPNPSAHEQKASETILGHGSSKLLPRINASSLQTNSELIGDENLVGQSPCMQELKQLILKVAKTNAPVWITGESGTGKELIARLIHQNGPRAKEPFVAINCGAIPSQLMESEMFGHVKGSFTGAHTNKPGLFNQAENGTLFLDEVAELPIQMQVKLLRAIQERKIRPVGSTHEEITNVRILSATHNDLSDEVEKGNFRHDLYYRLNVIRIVAPALRERREDIGDISKTILSKISKEENHQPPYTLSDASLSHLANFDFPGNVRELENILHRAVAMSESSVIQPDDLDIRYSQHQSLTDTERDVTENDLSNPERKRIKEALDATRWNRKSAAKLLGYTYRQLRYRIEQYGLNDDARS